MPITVSAVYENGAFHPTQPIPLHLAEGETVDITVERTKPAKPPLAEEEAARRIKAAGSLQEAFEILRDAPSWPDDYDIVKSLEDNRRWSAGLPPLPQVGDSL